MFGIGMPELIIILCVALIVIGPKKLPDLAKSLGRALGEFKKATNDLKDSIYIDDEIKDVKNTMKDIKEDTRASISKILDDGQEPEKSSLKTESDSKTGSEEEDQQDAAKEDLDSVNKDSDKQDLKPEDSISDSKEHSYDTPKDPMDKLKMAFDELNAKTESAAIDSSETKAKKNTS
jgi:sec-independent protein translocase protein TatB